MAEVASCKYKLPLLTVKSPLVPPVMEEAVSVPDTVKSPVKVVGPVTLGNVAAPETPNVVAEMVLAVVVPVKVVGPAMVGNVAVPVAVNEDTLVAPVTERLVADVLPNAADPLFTMLDKVLVPVTVKLVGL